ncbi:MAG: CRISPR system precrRNA processing endoribonuclease RAMP protein Cas6 [Bryobacteraceae bacterium]
MLLRLKVLRFSFVATRAFTFPTPASNKLRGAIGNNLWEREDDAYGRFFGPTRATGPSGLADPPRPFVLRAAHLDGSSLQRDGEFYFDLHLFDFQSGWEGILQEAMQLTNFAWLQGVREEPLTLNLDGDTGAVPCAGIRFLTPMELKIRGGIAQQPEFGILASRIRDRVSTLSQLYGDGPLAIDFAGFGKRAEQITMTRCDVRHVETQRRSGRTGQTHSLGGFVGEAEYSGELSEFIPYLRAAQWTGVGRQTTWGKGAIALQG